MPRSCGWARLAFAAGMVGLNLVPLPASAGRRPFLFAYDSEIIPEGDVEFEQWVWSESKVPSRPSRPAIYWIYWTPVIGLTNHFEMTLPVQLIASASQINLQTISAELRYRILPREDDTGFQSLVRLSVNQVIASRSEPSYLELGWVETYGRPNQLHLTANLGLEVALPWPEHMARPIILSYAAGASYPLPGGELKLSAEFLGDVGLQDTGSDTEPRHFLGGAIAWSRGRIWITAGCLFGLTGLSAASPRYMPRLIWAVAF